MTAWELPSSLTVGGEGLAIRTDYRVILDALRHMEDPTYENDERALILLQILYEDFERIPPERYEEALRQAVEFVDAGVAHNDAAAPRPTTMNWEQDAPLILPAVNHVLGQEVRALPYLHWWTFFGAYMEVRDSLYSSVLNIRQKMAKGQKLEKYEQEFYRENRAVVDLHRPLTPEQQAQRERLKKLRGKG